MKPLARTIDAVKLSAMAAELAAGGIEALVFDRAAASLWAGVIPARLMVADDDLARARRLLAAAGYREGADGEWDLTPRP